ncbi:MAG: oligosaccharide flippase family protein [Acidobacteria bacterium]|nr:oligosaccharide flippase family protein [Acidobacteriota bacterium]
MSDLPSERNQGGILTTLRTQLASGIFGRGGLSFLVAFAGISVSAFLYHLVVSRLLGPSHYGAMGALLGIISLLTVPIGAVQIAVTQAVVDEETKNERFSMIRVTRRATLSGLVAMVVVAAVTPVVDSFLHIGSPVPMLLVAVWVPLATVTAVVQGALIGEYRFHPVAFASFMGLGLTRLVLGTVLVKVGLGVSGAVAATIFAQAFTMLSLLYSARHELFVHSRHAVTVRTKLRDTILSIAALAGYTTLIGIDTFLANHFFVATAAGNYAAVAVGAHISFFVPAALVTVVFPHLADGHGASESSRRIFRQSLYVSLVLGLLAAAVMALFPHLTVSVLFGSKYANAAAILGVLSFASVAIGVVILFVYLHLARRSAWALTPWIGVALSVVLIVVDHRSMRSVATIMLVVSVVTMAMIALPAARHSSD